MKRFMHFEDNGDGTTSVTFKIGEHEEQSGLIALDFDGIFNMMGGLTTVAEVESLVRDVSTIIPNGVEL